MQRTKNVVQKKEPARGQHYKSLLDIRRNEEWYTKMIGEVEDYAFILLDKEGIILNWNKGAEKIKGYCEEDIVGKSFQEFYPPEDREKGLPQALLAEAHAQGKAVYEGWRLKKDGTLFWGSMVLTALHDGQQNIVGYSKVTRDLTEKKLAEDQMRQYMAQLELQNRELEQFVYVASHDLKEPLRKIQIYNSYISDNAVHLLDAKSKEFLDRSINASERMKALIDDLLSYSRATAYVEGYEEVDLNEVLAEIVSFHKEEIEQKKISLRFGRLPVVKGVPFQLKQLLSNLIGNAMKYGHPDRLTAIDVDAETVAGSAMGRYNVQGGRLYHKITVADNGIGFETQYAERIFEIFQRLNPSAAVKGSGIGLAICKKIVHNHHGFIEADGVPGEGARFSVYLPSDR